MNDTQLNDSDATETIEEGNALNIEETVVDTPAHRLNDEITSALENKFETFSESIESRLLNIEQIILRKLQLSQLYRANYRCKGQPY